VSASAASLLSRLVMIDIVLRIAELPKSAADVLATGASDYDWRRLQRHERCRPTGRLGYLRGTPRSRSLFFDREVVPGAGQRGASPLTLTRLATAGFCVAMLDDAGERTFITSPGAEGITSILRPVVARCYGVGDYVFAVALQRDCIRFRRKSLSSGGRRLSEDVVVAFDPSNRSDGYSPREPGARS